MKFGYARVSTPRQNLDRQIAALGKAGCEEIIQEKRSAASIERRPELKKLLGILRKGDILVLAEWDRVTRSFLDGVDLIKHIQSTGAAVQVLDINLDLTDPLQQALIGIWSAIAEKERVRGLQRAKDGRDEARERGVRFGPKIKLTATQMIDLRSRHFNEGKTQAELAQLYNISKPTVSRIINNPERYGLSE